MRILTFMHCLPKNRIEPVSVSIVTLDFMLTGNIHLAATKQILEIDGSRLQAGAWFGGILRSMFYGYIMVL
jgi:hypothetical protein